MNQSEELCNLARISALQDCEIIVLTEAKKLREVGEMKTADICMDIADKISELKRSTS